MLGQRGKSNHQGDSLPNILLITRQQYKFSPTSNSCTIKDLFCSGHWFLLDLYVHGNYVQLFVLIKQSDFCLKICISFFLSEIVNQGCQVSRSEAAFPSICSKEERKIQSYPESPYLRTLKWINGKFQNVLVFFRLVTVQSSMMHMKNKHCYFRDTWIIRVNSFVIGGSCRDTFQSHLCGYFWLFAPEFCLVVGNYESYFVILWMQVEWWEHSEMQ